VPPAIDNALLEIPGIRNWRLQCSAKLHTFMRMMNSQAALGFRHLRRFRITDPGWVAV
jgi:hypothetical protein